MRVVIAACCAVWAGSVSFADDLLVPSQFPTIQAAINAASTDDRVCVAPGIYVERITTNGKQIQVFGESDLETIIRAPAGGTAPVVTFNAGPRFDLRDVRIEGGRGTFGGGVRVESGANAFLFSVEIGDCTADTGGGVAVAAGGYAYFQNTDIRDCVAEFFGGGLACIDGQIEVQSIAVFDCDSGDDGGGAYLEDSSVLGFLPLLVLDSNDSGGQGGGLAARGTEFSEATSFSCFSNTAEGDGGAIHADDSTVYARFSTFFGNAAGPGANGGAIAAINGSDVTSIRGDYLSNSANDGGAVWVENSRFDADACWFDDNEASNDGGALNVTHFGGSTLSRVYRTSFSNNRAEVGAAAVLVPRAFTGSTTLELVNCDISNNSTTIPSGVAGVAQPAIFDTSNLFIMSCTIVDNVGGTVGGIQRAAGGFRLDNSIVWGNTPVDTSLPPGSTARHSIFPEFASASGPGNFAADPRLVPDATKITDRPFHRPMVDSPAVDRGDENLLALDWLDMDDDGVTLEPTPRDIVGFFRQYDDPFAPNLGVGDPVPDIGAYELARCALIDLEPLYFTLDFSDVLAFLVAFGAMDPIADLAPPKGVFDFSDVLAFLASFGAGCP